jgi:hypothetical protein
MTKCPRTKSHVRSVLCSVPFDDASLAKVLGDKSAGDEFDIAPFLFNTSLVHVGSVYTVMFTDIQKVYISCVFCILRCEKRGKALYLL